MIGKLRWLILAVVLAIVLATAWGAYKLSGLVVPSGTTTPTSSPTVLANVLAITPTSSPTVLAITPRAHSAVLAIPGTQAPPLMAQVVAGHLHLRSCGSVSCRVLGYLAAGDEVLAMSCNGSGWAEIPGGWVRSRWLDPDICEVIK